MNYELSVTSALHKYLPSHLLLPYSFSHLLPLTSIPSYTFPLPHPPLSHAHPLRTHISLYPGLNMLDSFSSPDHNHLYDDDEDEGPVRRTGLITKPRSPTSSSDRILQSMKHLNKRR